MYKLKYIDYKKLSLPFLEFYRHGVALPSGDNIIKVTENEKRRLMKMKNGHNPVWEEVIEIMEEDDGSR